MLIENLLEVLYVLTYLVGRNLYVMLDKLPLCTPILGVVSDLRNTKSANSLTGRGLSSLFKKGHALVFLPTLGLVDRAGLPQS